MLFRSRSNVSWWRRSVFAIGGVLALGGCGHDAPKQGAPPADAICERDAECDAGRCDPLVGCVACLFDGDCGADARCVDESCHATVACSTDDECASGACDTQLGRCQECAGDGDCAGAERCEAGICRAFVACTANTGCPDGEQCDVAGGACVDCLRDGDCKEGLACSDHRCLPRCEGHGACPDVYHCARGVCQLDVCEAGSTSCTATLKASRVCTAAGDAYELAVCGSGQSCSVEDGTAECRARVCSPSEWSCSEDWRTAELCSADGLEVAQIKDCAELKQVCEGGECVDTICEPNAKRCREHTLLTCSASGGSEQEAACDDDERCDDEQLLCVPRVCDPAAQGCLAETLATCKADGSAFEPTGEDCTETAQSCWQGACRPVVCEVGLACIDGDSYACVDNRTRRELAKACNFENGQFCNAETGQCQKFVCEPGLPTCNGDVSTSCADDGSHPLEFGIDCAANGKVCWAADCLASICEQGSYSCDGTTLQRCGHKGTFLEPLIDCPEGTVCDAEAETCRLQKCAPGLPACDGNIATTCTSDGLGYEGPATDCAPKGEVCVLGQCAPIICEANKIYCEQNEVRKCGSNGGSFVRLDICVDSEFCDAEHAVCAPDVCVGEAPLCNGNTLTTCQADGSGPAPGGTSCAAIPNQVCDQNACKALICSPHAQSCEQGNVVLCNSVGTVVAPYDNCSAREFCDASAPGNAVCAADLCPQAQSGCAGEQLATCNADGSGLTNEGTDCAATGKVCDLSGMCATTANDQLGTGGDAVAYSSSAGHLQLMHLLKARRLSSFDAAVAPSGSEPLAWVLYQSSQQLGTYNLLKQATGPSAVSSSYATSPALDVPLEAGRFYLLGVMVQGAHQATVLEGATPRPTSFGQMLGGFTFTAGTALPEQLVVGAGTLGDDVMVRVRTGKP